MTYHFTIDGTLPGMNDIVAKATYNRFAYGSFKKQWTDVCAWSIKAQRIPSITIPIKIAIHWIEKHKRRDLDNISGGGTKFLLDGLVKSEVIQNDTRQWVTGFEHYFPEPDAKRPRVEVYLEEITSNTL